MFLKRVNSDESSISMEGEKDPLDTDSFKGGMLRSLIVSVAFCLNVFTLHQEAKAKLT